jgi:hypothetical protein
MGANIEISSRDIAILRTLFESRLMTLSHATALHFDGRYESAKKCVQRLKAAGLVTERLRRVYEPSILHITKRGFDVLFKGGHISDYPRITWASMERRVRVSNLTLAHELEVMDVKSAIWAAVAKADRLKIIEFSTWPLLNQFKVLAPLRCNTKNPYTLIKPDGFIRIEESLADGRGIARNFFLEVDRGSESLSILVQKAQCYRTYYRDGGFAERHGLSREEYAKMPFVVLMVLQSEKRSNNVAKSLLGLSNPILQQVWLTSKESLVNALDTIWITPKACRYALEISSF